MKCFALFAAVATAATFLINPTLADDDNQESKTPMQVRLAYASDTGMVVSWNTYEKLDHPTVRYGRIPEALHERASSDVSVTYPTSTTYNNHVKITDLEPNTLYYYQPVPSNEKSLYSFKTSRPAGDLSSYSIAVAVDLGLMGPDGLTTHVGNGAANPLGPHDKNTIQSIEAVLEDIEFLWHRKSSS